MTVWASDAGRDFLLECLVVPDQKGTEGVYQRRELKQMVEILY